MKVSKEIQNKMHKLAKLTYEAGMLDREINDYFDLHGFDVDDLRRGDGDSLEELNYGNDITEQFCKDIENGKYAQYHVNI